MNHNPTLRSVHTEITVQPGATPGTYEVFGKTEFPDRSALRVAAVRYLYPMSHLIPTPSNFRPIVGRQQSQLNESTCVSVTNLLGKR